MITIGKVNKIIDVIGYNNNNELVYLGRDSGSPETELDNKNHAFFDTNNITYLKTTPIITSILSPLSRMEFPVKTSGFSPSIGAGGS